ncbi:MAG: DUF1080 domain-containing protein [Dysgonamonadaceae bacterium]|nr:DUF1080 domain-containing protein [Dysgonamonadaceae bacterium]
MKKIILLLILCAPLFNAKADFKENITEIFNQEIIKALDGDQSERIAATVAEINRKKEGSIKTVQKSLKDFSAEYRKAVLNAFIPYADKKSCSAILKNLPKRKPEVKIDIINFTEKVIRYRNKRDMIHSLTTGKHTLVQTLINELETDNAAIISSAASALVALDDTLSLNAFAKLLTNINPEIIATGKQSLLATKGDITTYAASVMHNANDEGKIAILDIFASRKSNNLKKVLFAIQQGSPEVKTAACRTLLKWNEDSTDSLIIDLSQNAVTQEYLDSALSEYVKKASETSDTIIINDKKIQEQSLKQHVSEPPDYTGFVPLFNGKDLSGWKGLLAQPYDNPVKRSHLSPSKLESLQFEANKQMYKDWAVENGSLVFIGHGYNNICTERKYGDFEMYADWMLDPSASEADAGIYLRGTPQVQIWDVSRTNVGAEVGSGGLYNNKIHPSRPLAVADNPLGEWNTMYIKMTGDRVTVKLNGILVVDNTVLENYWDHSQPLPSFEQIELQAHDSKVFYRNIYIKELPQKEPFKLSAQEEKEGFKILFDGTNMHSFTGDFVNYKLEDGSITVHPTTNFGGNLYTKDEYSNFVFRFEFQLTPSANNGVGIRAPLEGDNAYNAMEIQILDCEHPVYKDIMQYQHHGSIYGVMPAEHGSMRPVGEWNEEEIYADGNHIRVTLNGKIILDCDISQVTKGGSETLDHQNHPGLFNKSGHIGFLGHGSELKFRNIRIKEIK